MEKISNIKHNILIVSFTIFIFLWDVTLFNFNLKFLILLTYILVILDYKKFIKKFYDYKLLIFLFIFVHLYVSSEFSPSFYIIKSYIFLFLISYLVIFYKNEILLILGKSINLFYLILILIFIFQIILSKNYVNLNYLIDFFTLRKILFIENSHFAMISTSITIYSLNEFVIKNKNIYLFVFLLTLLIAYLNFSLTFFAGILLSCSFIIITNYLSLNKFQITAFILLMVISVISIYVNNKSLHKFKTLKENTTKNLNQEKIDLSVDVFLTSYKVMINSIKEKPFGYGFNNYEKAFNKHIDKIDIKHALTPFLNKQDGSNNFVKIVTETGVFSIIIVCFVIFFVFSNKIDLHYKLLIIPNFLVQSFFRGAGYFNGGYIIYLLLIILLVLDDDFKKK